MKEYHTIKQKDMLKTFEILQEFSDKFPLLKYNEVNFGEVGKMVGLKEKDFKTMIVFIDMLRKNKSFVTMEDVAYVKVKRNADKWRFVVVSTQKKETPYLEHTFRF